MPESLHVECMTLHIGIAGCHPGRSHDPVLRVDSPLSKSQRWPGAVSPPRNAVSPRLEYGPTGAAVHPDDEDGLADDVYMTGVLVPKAMSRLYFDSVRERSLVLPPSSAQCLSLRLDCRRSSRVCLCGCVCVWATSNRPDNAVYAVGRCLR